MRREPLVARPGQAAPRSWPLIGPNGRVRANERTNNQGSAGLRAAPGSRSAYTRARIAPATFVYRALEDGRLHAVEAMKYINRSTARELLQVPFQWHDRGSATTRQGVSGAIESQTSAKTTMQVRRQAGTMERARAI